MFRLVELVALFGGWNGADVSDIIDYINLDTTGDAIDFGNLIVSNEMYLVLHQEQEDVFGGGDTDPAYIDVIQFVTIASTGNTQDFGDLTAMQDNAMRLDFQIKLEEYLLVENNQHQEIILTMLQLHQTGNAIDFGDLSAANLDWMC